MLNHRRHRWRPILLSLLLMVLLPAPIISGDAGNDVLAYTLTNFPGGTSLMVYDPHNGVNIPVLTDVEFSAFDFSTDGRLAFSSADEGNAEIYVLDTLLPDSSPVNISQYPDANDNPLAWSPDGRYLAFVSHHDGENKLIHVWDGETAIDITPRDKDYTVESYGVSWSPDGRYLAFVLSDDDENKLIYVWDGETAIDITPKDMGGIAESYEVAWSFDGRLAFTVWYSFSSLDEDSPSEIYLWDGFTTTSFSQNPTGEDSAPTWNTDGRLAFLAERNGEYDVFLWDGVSVKNGSPDADTFTNVAPELTTYYSYPTWTNDGRLAFGSQSPQDTRVQIYVWNGQTETNISQNPDLHNGSPRWSTDGRWAFVTFFSPQQWLYVRDADNRTLLTVEGQYTPAWSSDGYLAFCTWDRPRWILSVWNGQDVIEIARGGNIEAQWQSGPGVVCSSG